MGPIGGKSSFLRNFLVRVSLFCVLVSALRFAYVVIIRGESCDVGDFCFFAMPENFSVITGVGQMMKASSAEAVVSSSENYAPETPKKIPDLWTTMGFQKSVQFYSSIFQDLVSDAVLSPSFKTLCVDTETGADVFALREIGVEDSIGISKRGLKPLVVPGQGFKQPFDDNTFDFVFCGGGVVENSVRPGDFVAEIGRTLRSEGFLVVHTAANDMYSFESLLGLFNFCRLVKSRDISAFNSETPFIREVVLQKITSSVKQIENSVNKCSVPSYKHDMIKKAEPLIEEEPKKPWITLKKNAKKIKYLPSMVDINFKSRYIYVDVGARSYGSSIVSWFKKQYPKQNKTFEIYAIEADKTFYPDYKTKRGVNLLPYAAWVGNESLYFEINEDPGNKEIERGRGMGRIQPVHSSLGKTSSDNVDEIQGFDFADWLKNTVTERDYVVMKMDVEGTEFDLIPRLIKTGAICLIDELFLECHYNRWQKCCPGERSPKYKKTYRQCLDLFVSLRKSGVLVHQWW